MKKFKFKLSSNSKRLITFSLFGAIALGSASSTLLFMRGNSASSGDNGGNNNDTITNDDETKNKLFENLTAADLDIKKLNISVSGLINDTNTLNVSFSGGANYLSFMKDQTGNLDVSLDDVTAKFGGSINLTMTDTSLQDNTMLKEDMRVYAPGDGKIYLDWNDTGYKVSGNFVSNTLKAVTLFLSEQQAQDLNLLLEKIQQIDILTLLPMVGTIGGSLASDKIELETGNYRYKIEIPGSLIGPEFTNSITLNLDCNKNGELINLSLNPLSLPVNGKKLNLSMSTESITMHGINSEGDNPNLDGYLEGLGDNILTEYYKNNLDSTPNLINTFGKIMKSKAVNFGYELAFQEYEYNESSPSYESKLGEENTAAKHSFEGSLKGDFSQGFDKGNYAFTLDKTSQFANSVSVQYQAKTDTNSAKGIFIQLNNTKAYMSDGTINDLFTSTSNVVDSQEINTAFSNGNEILNNSVIGDIIKGNYYKYKEVLKKIELIDGADETVTLKITILLGALGLNIPFQFESTPVEININYDNTSNMDANLINFVEIKNIPIRKVARLVNEQTVTYLDTATLRMNLSSVTDHGINIVKNDQLDQFADFKATIPLFNSISGIVKEKRFNSNYTLIYNNEGNKYQFEGEIAADLSAASFDSTAALTDRNFGEYRLTTRTLINNIAHNVQLDYIPNSQTKDQTLYFNYYSHNPDYRTRLSLETQTMTNMFDVISSLISQNNGSNSGSSSIPSLNKDIFGTITNSLNSYTDFVNGDIWNLLNSELPTDKVTISNPEGNKDKLKVSIQLSLFDSTLNTGSIDLVLGKNAKEYSSIGVNVPIPNTKDSVTFVFNFDKFTNTSTGLTVEETSKYKQSDSSVNAIMDIMTGSFLDSFNLGGFVSTKRQTPRF